MQKILLLEDDLNLNRGIALLLSREGYEVRQVYTIKEAKEAFQKGDYALVISAEKILTLFLHPLKWQVQK